ncbi:hypothetical protein WJX77_008736 [Trebouxia sp. C0004]
MPIGKMHRRCFLLAAVCVLTVVDGAQSAASGNLSTSLRVGDYAAGQLSNGTALPLYTLLWRAVGSAFSSNTAAVNQTFAQNANTAFLQAPHTMTYTVVNIRNAAASNTTRKVNGAAVEQISDPSNSAYSSTDLLMRATFTQDSVWEDLSVTQQAYRQQVSSNLKSYGWDMTAVLPLRIAITSEAAQVLSLMPIPGYSSYRVVLQVSGSNVVPMSLQTQNLISDTLLTLLSSDHVFLMKLAEVDETQPENGVGSATMAYVMQKASATTDVTTALSLVLGNPSAAGSQAASAFSLTMSNHSINVIAAVISQSPLAGDSIGDQMYALTHSSSSTTKHLGAILGSSIGSAVALLLLLATAVVFGRGWLKQRHLQKQAAARHKVQNGSADVEDGRTIFPDGGSSLTHHPSPDLPGTVDPAAANCWDIDAADIVICKHPDGSDWLLNVSVSGKVYRAVRGGVQDVVVKVLTHSTNSVRQDLRKEVDVLKSVSYDRNVVQFYGTCPLGSQTMLVLEYMEGGDLRHALTNSSNGELQWRKKGAVIALDLVRGLHFLHSHGVMHMDLKASNVLLTKTNSIAKIGDVDVAQVVGSTTLQRPCAATFAYSAPELILDGTCTEKVDMYSFGVILWELITTEVPRRGRLRAIKAPEECPAEIEQLIDLCLATDPRDRPTAKQAFDIISACSPHLAAPSPPTPPQPIHVPDEPQLTDSQATWRSAAAADLHNRQALAEHRSDSAGNQTQQQAPAWASAQEQCHTPCAWQPSHADARVASGQMSTDQLQTAGSTADSQTSDCRRTAQAVPSEPADMRAQHQLPKRRTERQDSSQHSWWPDEYGQDSTGQHVSSTHASGMLPLGAQGHLYPSPFAMAVDDSGPLWSWPDAAQNVA